jgi:peptidoglycan/xylan/chitin deacetylase (PgdA/CDA1 family)
MIPILLYHSVSDHPARSMRRYAVPTTSFERHCRILAASGRTPMTVSAFADGLRSAILPPDPVVVTFDDGYSDTSVAARRLADAGLTATVYITTSWLGRPWMLSEADIRRMTAFGVEIGGHGHTHRRLDELGEAELEAELTVCRRSLAAVTGTDVISFSYPHGSHDERTRRAVAAAGYRSACTTRNATTRTDDDVFTLARLTVTADVPDTRIAAWLDGQARQASRGEPLPSRFWRHVRRAQTGLRPCTDATAAFRTGPSSRPGVWSTGAGCRPGGSSHSWTA